MYYCFVDMLQWYVALCFELASLFCILNAVVVIKLQNLKLYIYHLTVNAIAAEAV